MSTRALFLAALAAGPVAAAHLRANGNHAGPAPALSAPAVVLRNVSAMTAAWQEPPCECVANDAKWKKTAQRPPKCIFIDLGAADGNTLAKFLEDGYGEVKNCPSNTWEAYLVEANPQFAEVLNATEKKYPAGQVHALTSTAAFTCQGETSFFIDTDPANNHWGSSMSSSSPDAIKSGKVKVTVPTVNVIQLIAENVLPEDWVMLKVDIEGAEYELLPCLAQFKEAGLIDRMFLEEHWWFKTGSSTTPEQMQAAKEKLQAMHVDIPLYYSGTF